MSSVCLIHATCPRPNERRSARATTISVPLFAKSRTGRQGRREQWPPGRTLPGREIPARARHLWFRRRAARRSQQRLHQRNYSVPAWKWGRYGTVRPYADRRCRACRSSEKRGGRATKPDALAARRVRTLGQPHPRGEIKPGLARPSPRSIDWSLDADWPAQRPRDWCGATREGCRSPKPALERRSETVSTLVADDRQ